MVFNMVSLGQNVKTGLYLLHYILIVYVHYFSIVLEKEKQGVTVYYLYTSRGLY